MCHWLLCRSLCPASVSWRRAGYLKTWAFVLISVWEGIYLGGSCISSTIYVFFCPWHLAVTPVFISASLSGILHADILHWQILYTSGNSEGDLQTSGRPLLRPAKPCPQEVTIHSDAIALCYFQGLGISFDLKEKVPPFLPLIRDSFIRMYQVNYWTTMMPKPLGKY